ncbi:hypothetical protein [Microvirga lotononidis]|uniref:hypothetical protein n=1 Tax=Microvirga lotononidis TaxID=864069 RepID=UPI0002F96609|nr:hypothetical protein [Microvirga lotononidis]WQO28326.1 hypothetical protein U0023_04270 [Microvirga lotononidis]
MRFQTIKEIVLAICAVSVAGCQGGGSAPVGDPAGFQYNAPGSASARVNAELDAEARAFGAAQGAAGLAAAMDPTGLSVIPLTVGGGIAHKAWLAKNHAKMEAAAEEDIQSAYRKYGMNPDGTPSGKPGPGSAPAE